jgi:hypothetical protein
MNKVFTIIWGSSICFSLGNMSAFANENVIDDLVSRRHGNGTVLSIDAVSLESIPMPGGTKVVSGGWYDNGGKHLPIDGYMLKKDSIHPKEDTRYGGESADLVLKAVLKSRYHESEIEKISPLVFDAVKNFVHGGGRFIVESKDGEVRVNFVDGYDSSKNRIGSGPTFNEAAEKAFGLKPGTLSVKIAVGNLASHLARLTPFPPLMGALEGVSSNLESNPKRSKQPSSLVRIAVEAINGNAEKALSAYADSHPGTQLDPVGASSAK